MLLTNKLKIFCFDIFINKLNIMSKSHKPGKPKANRGNQVKRNSLIKKNEEILSRLKNQ